MPSEFAVVLSDYKSFEKIARVLSRRGMGAFHAPTLADLARIESVYDIDLLVVDGGSGYTAGEGSVAVLPSRKGTSGVFQRIDGHWTPAGRFVLEELYAA